MEMIQTSKVIFRKKNNYINGKAYSIIFNKKIKGIATKHENDKWYLSLLNLRIIGQFQSKIELKKYLKKLFR